MSTPIIRFESSPDPQIPQLDISVREYSIPEQGFYMTLTESAYQTAVNADQEGSSAARSLSKSAIRPIIEATIANAIADPLGEQSIDTFKYTDAGQTARIVHKVSEAGEDLLGMPVAIKGTGRNTQFASLNLGRRSNLKDQFELMHRLYVAQTQLHPNGIDGMVFVNQPLAYIRHRMKPSVDRLKPQDPQEWLVMERVVDAKPVKELSLVLSIGGLVTGFESSDYPELAEFADPYLQARRRSRLINFDDLAKRFRNHLAPYAFDASDIVGHNILEQREGNGEVKYTFIDMQAAY